MFDLAGGMVGIPTDGAKCGGFGLPPTLAKETSVEAECAPQERRAGEGSEGNITQDETGT
jgi:hypothetical protein